jgi:hypothetical protein
VLCSPAVHHGLQVQVPLPWAQRKKWDGEQADAGKERVSDRRMPQQEKDESMCMGTLFDYEMTLNERSEACMNQSWRWQVLIMRMAWCTRVGGHLGSVKSRLRLKRTSRVQVNPTEHSAAASAMTREQRGRVSQYRFNDVRMFVRKARLF